MISCVISASVMRVLYSGRCISRRPAAPASVISCTAVSSRPLRMGLVSPRLASIDLAPSSAPALSNSHWAESVLRGAS